MSKIDEIKQALAAATPGPWSPASSFVGDEADGIILWAEIKDRPGAFTGVCEFHPDTFVKDEDVNLIANAPEYIAYLVETLEEVLLDRDIAKQNRKQWEKAFDNADKQYLLKEKEAAELRRQLEGNTEEMDWLRKEFEEARQIITEEAKQADSWHELYLATKKELEEARKISFPRQADGEGGWTIDFSLLRKIQQLKSEYPCNSTLEEIESVLLVLEAFWGQEGEGNQ